MRRIGREEAFGIVEVFPSRSNVRRVIVTSLVFVTRNDASLVFVTRNDPGRIQCFDDVERVKPGVEASAGGFGEVLVDVVVDHVTCDDETDRRHVQHGGVVPVTMANFHDEHLGTVDGESVCGHRLRQD